MILALVGLLGSTIHLIAELALTLQS